MSQSIASSRGFSGKTLKGDQIGELCCRRPSTHGVWTENNTVI